MIGKVRAQLLCDTCGASFAVTLTEAVRVAAAVRTAAAGDGWSRVGMRDVCAACAPHAPGSLLEKQLTTYPPKGTSCPTPQGGSGQSANDLARAEWQRRVNSGTPLVIKFIAFRQRIQEALDAGHPPERIAAVLPRMPTFTRNAFDFALSQAKRGPQTNVRRNTNSGPHGYEEVNL